MINILMPLADGHCQSVRSLASFCMQDIKWRIFPVSRPMALDKRESEAEARNALIKFANGEFTAMIDRGVVFASQSDLSDCMKFLVEHPEWDAVALDTKGQGQNKSEEWMNRRLLEKHVIIACVVYRTEIFKNIVFRAMFPTKCLCYAVNYDIKIRYLDGRQLTEDRGRV